MTICRLRLIGASLLASVACASPPEVPAPTSDRSPPTEAVAAPIGGESGQDARLQRVLGTKASLIPPPGFVAADAFSGFVNQERGSSIIVTVMPGPYAQIVSAFEDPATAAAQGMKVEGSSERAQGELSGRLLQLRQVASGVEVKKWLWVFGDASTTVMVMGTCLEAACSEELPLLKSAVLSTVWEPELDISPLEGLGFRLGDHAGLSVAGRMGKMLSLTSTGDMETEARSDVSFMFGPATGSGPIDDHEAFARQRIATLPYEDLVVDTVEALTADGLEGLIVLAEANEPGGPRVFVFGVLLFEAANYWIGVGSAPVDQRASALPRFKQIAASFERD